MAVDPTDARFVAVAGNVDEPDFSCSLHLSGDGGRGWLPGRPVPRLPTGAEKCYAPEVAFDRGGRLYFLFVGLQGPDNQPMGAFLAMSDDRGRTFGPPRRLLGPRAFMVRMAVDAESGERGRIHVVWVQAGAKPTPSGFASSDNPVLAAYSDDGGATLSRPVRVSDPTRQRVLAPALAVADERVHVAYYDLGDDVRDYAGLEGPVWEESWSLVVSTSGDGGRRFGRGVVAEPAVVPPERLMVVFTSPSPALVADGSGRVYLAWWDARSGDWDVFLRRSNDGGRTWQRRQRLNDDAAGNGRHQYLPRLALAPSGRLDAVFYDRRNDPENVRNEVSYTFSGDGGRTFAPSVALTTRSSDSRIGPSYPSLPSATGLVEFGSRLGLASTGDRALAAWTDTRDSRVGTSRQHLVAGGVAQPGAGGRQGRSWPQAAWVMVPVLALAGGTFAIRRRAVRRRRAADVTASPS